MANDDNRLNRIADPAQLKASLMQERAGFAHWDNWRRLKIDLILEAIDSCPPRSDMLTLEAKITELAENSESLSEIKDSSIKIMRIHYLAITRTPDELRDYNERRSNAIKKLEEYRRQLR